MSGARVWALPGLGGMGGLRAEFAAGTETPHPSHRKKQALPAVHPNSKPWRLTLIDRKLGESLKHVLNITLPILLGRCPKVSRIGAVRVLDMATVVTILAQERVAQDREQPRVYAGARLELLDVPPRAKDGVLYKAVRIIGVAGQRDRE